MQITGEKKKWLMLCTAAIAILAYAHFETYWIEIKKTTVESGDLPQEFSGKKIVFIADIHCGKYFTPHRLNKIIKQINSLDPDILIFGGDYIDRSGKFLAPCLNKLTNINAPLGKFGVLGNHDVKADFNDIKNAMIDAGITPLVNENRKIEINNVAITVTGVDEPRYGDPDGAKAMKNSLPFTIYVEHDPAYFEEYDPKGADLLLAGHTHGGQITFFGVPFTRLAHWHNYKYEKGVLRENNRTVIVTNGIGVTILPLRFFARPQINVILLKNTAE